MVCKHCLQANDDDARFCTNCGRSMELTGPAAAVSDRGRYRLVLWFLPVVLLVIGFGYYKFILPSGIAAVVNGEDISLAEVDGVVRTATNGMDVTPELSGRMRYLVLSRMISERVAEQEANKAEVHASATEIQDALDRFEAASGLDHGAFEKRITEIYGSTKVFRRAIERQITVKKYISEKIAAGIADPARADEAVDRWLQESMKRATVRIALAEEAPQAGCGNCQHAAGQHDCGMQKGGPASGGRAAQQTAEAERAAKAFWQERHHGENIETRAKDFGCHVQVEMVKGGKVVASLRYQNGKITEQ